MSDLGLLFALPRVILRFYLLELLPRLLPPKRQCEHSHRDNGYVMRIFFYIQFNLISLITHRIVAKINANN